MIGQGGMAVVHLAHDELLDRNVAVKVLRPGFAEDPQFVDRFRREARHAASLHDPNITTIYDTGLDAESAATTSSCSWSTVRIFRRSSSAPAPSRSASRFAWGS